jgi:acetyl esterase/lipase
MAVDSLPAARIRIANYMKVLAGHGYTMVAVEYPRGYGTTYPKPVEQVNAALSGFSLATRRISK